MEAVEKVKFVASRVGHIWDDVTDIIIRPQRSKYRVSDLGPKVFRISDHDGSIFVRDDFEIVNMRGLTVQCSWYEPKEKAEGPIPCVIYSHGNCGSRLDGMDLLWVLRHGISLFTYDACGSGLSEGEYVSLGFYERQDLAAVCEHVRETGRVSAIGLWGRSMGAVASIMYAAKDNSIACLVADSPFSSLGTLTEELVERHAAWIPNFVANTAVRKVRHKVVQKAGFDFRDLVTTKYAMQCDCPSFVFHGDEDDFVVPSHSERISEAYGGSCLFRLVKGGHNSERGADVQTVAVPFLKLYLIDKVNEVFRTQEAQVAASKAAADSIANEIREQSPKRTPGSSRSSSESEYDGEEDAGGGEVTGAPPSSGAVNDDCENNGSS